MPDTFTLLSGEPEAVNKTVDQYGMARSRDDKTGDVAHPALVHVISPDGHIRYTLNNPPARWIEDAVRRTAS